MHTTSITIDFWEFVVGIAGVLVLFIVVLIAAGRMLIEQLDKRSAERDTRRKEENELRDKAIQSVNDKADRIERDVLKLTSMLPNEYVRREDWIRFSSSIDFNLDKLREKQEDMRQVLTQIAERIKTIVGVTNER